MVRVGVRREVIVVVDNGSRDSIRDGRTCMMVD